jgi:predicted RNA methylase
LGPLRRKRILEPSAGTGGIVRRLLAAGATDIVAIEPDQARCEAIQEAPEVQVLMAEHRPYVINTRFEAWAHSSQRFDLVPTLSVCRLTKRQRELW